MSRNRTHGLFVQGGVRLDHLADVILSRYPDARLTENMVRLDLGVPEPERVAAPVTGADLFARQRAQLPLFRAPTILTRG